MLAPPSTDQIKILTGSARISFYSAPYHTNRDSHTCTRSKWTTRSPYRPPCHQLLSEHLLMQGVLDGSIPSGAWNTTSTLNAGKLGGKFIPTALKSTKVLALADGHHTPATNIALLKHKNLRQAECTVHIVPDFSHKSLLSGGQFDDAVYASICNGTEVNIYDGRTSRITV